MPAAYTCECRDGKTITGIAKWLPSELKTMRSDELATVFTELKAFAEYYTQQYYYPEKRLNTQCSELEDRYTKSKRLSIIFGIAASTFTVLWILMASIPLFRYSAITLILAILTLVSILLCIPCLLVFIDAQGTYAKKHPKLAAKLKQLQQKQDSDVYTTYVDYLVSGFIAIPDYALSADVLEYATQCLNNGKADNLRSVLTLCKQKYPESPIPKIVMGVKTNQSSVAPVAYSGKKSTKTVDINQMQNSGPDIGALIQLSDYLGSALRSFASNQKHNSPAESNTSVSELEMQMLTDYRKLSQDDKNRVRRVIRSFIQNYEAQ